MFLAKWSIVFSGLGNVFELAKLWPGHRSCTIINVSGLPKRWLQHRAERLLMFSIAILLALASRIPSPPCEHALTRTLVDTLDRFQPGHLGGGERGRGKLRPRTPRNNLVKRLRETSSSLAVTPQRSTNFVFTDQHWEVRISDRNNHVKYQY